MHDAGARIFLEVGPRAVLTGLTRRILDDRPHVAISVDQRGRPATTALLHALAALAVEGVPFSAERLFRGRRARLLDPRTLAPLHPDPERSPATWLVNGGRARPASEPLRPIDPLSLTLPMRSEEPMTNANGAHSNGHRGDVEIPPPAPPPAAPAPPPLAGERSADVMARHHLVMQHFLETEKSVMLAYLTGRGGAGGVGATVSEPVRAVPAPPTPPALPVAAATETAPPEPAPPAPPAPAAPEPAPPAAAGADVDIAARLLAVVSERTGYPPDMLDLDADLESDLGVDSIKRVEIAGTMMQDMALPPGVEPDVEELTASRTLREVIGVLERLAGGAGPPGASGSESREQPVPFEGEPAEGRIGRFVLHITGAPPVARAADLDRQGTVAIIDDGGGVAPALAEALSGAGHDAVVVAAQDAQDAGPALLGILRGERERVSALVHLAALGAGPAPELGALLELAQAVGEDLEQAAAHGGAALLGATRMGGDFAVCNPLPQLDPRAGAIPGFLKSVAQEWPQVRVKAVNVGAGEDAGLIAERLLDELLAGDGLVEVGYRGGERLTPTLAPTPTEDRESSPPLDADAVVLVTGGARGITAETAIELAAGQPCTFVLAGRSEVLDEDPATAGAGGERELQQAIIDRRRAAGEALTPPAVRTELHAILAAREVRDTLARLRATGARARYVRCDVGDPDALGALVDCIYSECGRLDGVLHGAGVIEDRLVRDKDRASAERVLATKAGAALTLADRLRPDGLRFLVLFGSVSGRFGNRGQADYAAASEVLNKLAQILDRRWTARVVAINWGPWADVGMVSEGVARQFRERGVALIPPAVGRTRLVEELGLGRKGETEVLIGGAGDAPSAPPSRPSGAFLCAPAVVVRRDGEQLEAIRRLEPEHDRLLDHHRLDGKAVLPFTGAIELDGRDGGRRASGARGRRGARCRAAQRHHRRGGQRRRARPRRGGRADARWRPRHAGDDRHRRRRPGPLPRDRRPRAVVHGRPGGAPAGPRRARRVPARHGRGVRGLPLPRAAVPRHRPHRGHGRARRRGRAAGERPGERAARRRRPGRVDPRSGDARLCPAGPVAVGPPALGPHAPAGTGGRRAPLRPGAGTGHARALRAARAAGDARAAVPRRPPLPRRRRAPARRDRRRAGLR